jgi:endonuclease/exonuclease/phosphatase family metal-dependent hydrolase
VRSQASAVRSSDLRPVREVGQERAPATVHIGPATGARASATLVRSWNLFHGRSDPPGDGDFLEAAVRLACADRPDVLCLQEVPPWALARLTEWTGMRCFGDVARPPPLGLLPLSRSFDRRLTSLNPTVLRPAFSGQANAILVGPELLPRDHRSRSLNSADVKRILGPRLQWRDHHAWGRERRCCQALRITLPDRRPALVANLHATCDSPGCAELELRYALGWVEAIATPGEIVVLAGDLNLEAASSALPVMLAERGFSSPGPAIDHVLVRGAAVSPVVSWVPGRRMLDGRVSDHAPVELTIAAT